ncbi:MAG TPA: hypothetical protein VK576_00435, partial [Thermoleophilia bacterium]|nr:hypothetical protein [Thermoleophilia bacterium]
MAVVAAAVLLVAATTAWAAPPSDTISTTDIQAMLDGGGSVTGYFDTVLGGATLADQAPTPVPVTIKAIVPGANPTGSGGDLILFEASGTDIATIGGIAHGMSGSPLYVDDGGTFKLAGAVSYGDIFTTHNLGLATPIADMIAIETNYMSTAGLSAARVATTAKLAAPVKTSAGTIGSVVVAPSSAAARSLSRTAAGPVMAPLTTVQISGLDHRSKLYQKLAASLEARGVDVSPFSAGSRLGAAPPAPDEPGAPLGAMYSTGDVTIGAFGTVTYVDPDNDVLVAFGHPFDWLGPDSLILTSAWVQGIWSTTYDPYWVASPGLTVGEITQDRAAGIAGTLGVDTAHPALVGVDSQATMGTLKRNDTSKVSSWIVQNPLFGGLPSAVAGAVMMKAADAFMLPGSATTSATIHVTDGVSDYTIQRDNVWSDPFDVTSFATGDIDSALSALVPAPA